MILCMVLVVPAHLDGMPASGVQQALPRSAQMRGGSLGPTGGSDRPFYRGLSVRIQPLAPAATARAPVRSDSKVRCNSPPLHGNMSPQYLKIT